MCKTDFFGNQLLLAKQSAIWYYLINLLVSKEEPMINDRVVIHMLNDGRDGIEGIPGRITLYPPPRIAGPMQDAFVEVTLSWNRNQNRCGPFKINIGPLATKHFDLVLSPNLPLPLDPALTRIFGNMVGLRARRGEQGSPSWGEGDAVQYITGAGTPWPEPDG